MKLSARSTGAARPLPLHLRRGPWGLTPHGPLVRLGCLLTLSCFVVSTLVVGSGCRSQRERYVVDAFSAEARMMEDKIYELQDRVSTLERRLARPGADESSESRARGSGARAAPARSSPSAPPRSPAPVPGFDFDEIPDLTPPEVDPGSPVNPSQFRSSSQRVEPSVEAREQVAVGSSSSSPSATQVASRPTRRVSSGESASQVTGLEFDAYLLGDAPPDGSQVNGLELVIVPLNDRSELVPVAGEVTVVVLDARDGSHLGRWEYDSATARVAMQAEGEDPGILLELRWQQVLRDPRLHVFVRFTLPDGRRLESDRPFIASGTDAVQYSPVVERDQPEGGSAEPRQLTGEEWEDSTELPGEGGSSKKPPEKVAGPSPTGSSGPILGSSAPRTVSQPDQGPPAAIYR